MICLPSPIVLKYRLIKQRNELLGHLVVYRSKSLSCTLSAVDVSLSLLTFLINTSRYTSTTTSTRVLREVSYSKRPHGTQLQRRSSSFLPCHFIETAGYFLGLPELSQRCHPSTRGSTRSLLRTLCTAFTFVGFLHWIKESVGLDEQRLITKSFAGCFLLPWRAVSHHSLLCRQTQRVANLSRW